MKGHLATQVKALIQSEKKPAGGGVFDERQVEGEEHAATRRFPTLNTKNQNVPAPAGSLKCVFDGPSPLESQSAVMYSRRQGKGTEGGDP